MKYSNGVLDVSKVTLPPLNITLFDEIQTLYEKYRRETILDDIAYFNELIEDRFALGYDLIKLDSITDTTPLRSVASILNESCDESNVNVTVHNWPNKINMFKLPYLTDGKYFNVKGKRKVLLQQLVPIEGLSDKGDTKEPTLRLKYVNRETSFVAKKTKVVFKYQQGCTLELAPILKYYMLTGSLPANLFANQEAISRLSKCESLAPPTLRKELQSVEYQAFLQSKASDLGRARESINDCLSINVKQCLGKVLALDVYYGNNVLYPKGTTLTETIIQDINAHAINVIYIIDPVPAVTQKLAYTMLLDTDIEPDAQLLADKSCEWAPPKHPGETGVVKIREGSPITDGLREYLIALGEYVITTNNGTVMFYREIMGNNTFLNGELIPELQDPTKESTEWIYLGDAEDNLNKLTPWDFAAIFSVLTTSQRTQEQIPIEHRDYSFLKEVKGIDRTLSDVFRRAAMKFCLKYHNSLKAFAKDSSKLEDITEKLERFDKYFNEAMLESRVLAPLDMTNPLSIASHLTRVSTNVANTSSVSGSMRTLSMGMFGRLCPYETPSGNKVGLVNNRAIGSRVIGTDLKAPYYRVTHNGGISKIDMSSVVYLSAKEEVPHVIADIGSLEITEDGVIKSKSTLVRMKDAVGSRDGVTVNTVAIEKVDMVTTHPEQQLSIASAMMPFMGANDAIRCTYALSMYKQAVTLVNSEAPIVTTSMYEDLFKLIPVECYLSPVDGVISFMDNTGIEIETETESGTEFTFVSIPELTLTLRSLYLTRYKVQEGDVVKKGDLLADTCMSRDGSFSPGKNAIVAYVSTGFNYDDGVDIAEGFSYECTSLLPYMQSTECNKGDIPVNISSNNNIYPCIRKGDPIASIRTDGKRYTVYSQLDDGILLKGETVYENGQLSYKQYVLKYKSLGNGDKLSGRHGNKEVTSRIMQQSKVPMFRNGRTPDVFLNPTGVPSRMNIGQILEAHMGFVGYLLGLKKIISDPFNGATTEEVAMLLKYVYRLANEDDAEAVFKDFPQLPTFLHDRARERLEFIRDWKGCFNEKGQAYLWDPVIGKELDSPVTFGVSYILKLEQEVDHKLHTRGGTFDEPYSISTSQPTEGAAKGGGQRIGDYELAALMEYGCSNLVKEIISTRSDDIEQRNLQFLADIGYPELSDYSRDFSVPRSTESLRYILEGMGVCMDDLDPNDPTLTDITFEESKERAHVTLHGIESLDE